MDNDDKDSVPAIHAIEVTETKGTKTWPTIKKQLGLISGVAAGLDKITQKMDALAEKLDAQKEQPQSIPKNSSQPNPAPKSENTDQRPTPEEKLMLDITREEQQKKQDKKFRRTRL